MNNYTFISGKDGFGSQYQKIIQTLIYCKYNKLKFVYKPITAMEHNYDNDQEYISKMENLMNIKNNIENDENNDAIEIDFGSVVMKWFEKNINNPSIVEDLNLIKSYFWQNKERNVFKNDKVNVAVHVRRQNQHDTRRQGTDTSDEYYLNIIKNIKNKYTKKNLNIHIYSQGHINNFKIYEADNVILHINEPISKTFIEFVAADILVTSASSFSYVAALLSDGEVYYKKFWHNPMKHWIIC